MEKREIKAGDPVQADMGTSDTVMPAGDKLKVLGVGTDSSGREWALVENEGFGTVTARLASGLAHWHDKSAT